MVTKGLWLPSAILPNGFNFEIEEHVNLLYWLQSYQKHLKGPVNFALCLSESLYVWQNSLSVCLSVSDLCPSVCILCLFFLSLHLISITSLFVLLLCICVTPWVYLSIISPVCQSVFGFCPFLWSVAFIFPSVHHSFPGCFGYLFYVWCRLSSRMQVLERKNEFPMIWQYQ